MSHNIGLAIITMIIAIAVGFIVGGIAFNLCQRYNIAHRTAQQVDAACCALVPVIVIGAITKCLGMW